MYTYSLRKPVKHCLEIGKIGSEQAVLLHHVYKTNVNEEEKLRNVRKVVSAIPKKQNKKQWSFKAFGSFKEINCINV